MPTSGPKPRNKFETRLYKDLTKNKVKFEYETVRLPYIIKGYYLPDFIVDVNGHKIFIESKGHFRPEAKRKMAAVKSANPELDIRIVFYSRKLKDIRWAEKHGFLWAIGDIPSEWYA